MKLQEKILYLRKKSGYSQEALAEKLGVSRQAVSKWENGDADPEIGKLKLLAELFQVSTDWLLSDTEPVEEPARNVHRASSIEHHPHWTENIPGIIGKLIKKYGWLFGVYMAVSGAVFAGIGMLTRVLSQKMLSSFTQNPYGDVFGMEDPFANIIANNPVTIMGSFIMYFGILLLIAGTVLAVILKNKSNEITD